MLRVEDYLFMKYPHGVIESSLQLSSPRKLIKMGCRSGRAPGSQEPLLRKPSWECADCPGSVESLVTWDCRRVARSQKSPPLENKWDCVS